MNELQQDRNSPEQWNQIWEREGDDTWRTYPKMFERVIHFVKQGSTVLDLGCGVGKLLDRLKAERQCETLGVDISEVAVRQAIAKGHTAIPLNITQDTIDQIPFGADYIIATEMLEHLEQDVLDKLLNRIAWAVAETHAKCIFAVPNNCLGPDEEPQHHHKWTALQFKRMLEEYFDNVRVECIDEGCPRLMAFVGWEKPFKLAFTMPVKNEGADIERVLKSFRGACDVMVIGVDDATTDTTKEIAERYADEVFTFTWENNFSKARNACIDRCRTYLAPNDWIFMSEGHEHLEAGTDELLSLDQVPGGVHIIEVRREDRDHAWLFPWLFRNRSEIFFENPVHNALAWDDTKSQVAQIPAIRTWHQPSKENRQERAVQRRYMNRQELIKKLAADPSDARSCYYLANEWRREDNDKAINYYTRYLGLPGKNGPERYQARLSLAECFIKRVQNSEEACATESDEMKKRELRRRQQEDMQAIYNNLVVAVQDDWSRNEHWIYLGDLCHKQGNRMEQAMRFYELAAVSIGREPLTYMWIEKANYGWVPAQKLVTIYAEAGMLKEALHWCDRVAELLPEWAIQEAKDEVQLVRQTIMQKMEESSHEQ